MAKLKLDINEKVTSNLPFKPQLDLNNLCSCRLISVNVETSETKTIKDNGETSTWEYAGLTVPRLQFVFSQTRVSEDRILTYTENVISEIKEPDTQEPSYNLTAEWYERMWYRMRHILDAFKLAKNYKEIVAIPDFSVIGDSKAKIAEFTTFFTLISDTLNKGTNGKPVFTNYDLIIKLLANWPDHKYLTIPTFVSKGFIERLNIVDGELKTTLEVYPSDTVELSRGKQPPSGQQHDHSAPEGGQHGDMKSLLDN